MGFGRVDLFVLYLMWIYLVGVVGALSGFVAFRWFVVVVRRAVDVVERAGEV